MRRATVFGIFALSAILAQSAEGNSAYRCAPFTVIEDAAVYALGDVDVSVFSDPDDNICTFTVEGASIVGPATSNEIEPIVELMDNAISGDVEPLVQRLVLARANSGFDVVEIVEDITAALAEQTEELERCVAATRSFGEDLPEPLIELSAGVFLYLRVFSDDVRMIECTVYAPESAVGLFYAFTTLRLSATEFGENMNSSIYVSGIALQ